MNRYDFLLFDADETLLDFPKASQAALRRALELYGIPYPPDVWERFKVHNDLVWRQFERGERDKQSLTVDRFRMLFSELSADADPVAFNRNYVEELARGGYVLPGALELCKKISEYYPLYIVTNGMAATQHGRLSRSPIAKYVKKTYISDEIGFQKPRREFFDAVLADLGASDRSRVLLLGDSLTSDMQGGVNAGIRTCWYNPGYRDAGGIPVDFMIHTLEEFPSLVL